MILNNRQTAILYELIENEEYLNYQYLCNKFHCTEKTVRTDIKKLNDFLKKDNIKVILKHGVGFCLECEKDKKDLLKSNFDYRYKDSTEIVSIHSKRDISINYYLSKGPIKEEELANRLHTNLKNITKTIKDIRKKIDEYNLTLSFKPRIGLSLQGNEINIRNYLIDSASFMISSDINELFYDNAKMFNISSDELNQVLNILIEGVKKYKININQHALIVLVVAIMISKQRYENNYKIEMSDLQKTIIRNYDYYDSYNIILSNVEQYYNYTLNESERDFIIGYSLILNGNCLEHINEKIIGVKKYQNIEKDYKTICKVLSRYKLCKVSQLNIFEKELKEIIASSYLRKELGYVENDYNNSFRVIMINSPLSIMVGTLLNEELDRILNCKIGNYIKMSLIVSVYNQIRYIDRTTRLCHIAIFTPLDKESCISIKDRILYHFNSLIEDIEILTTSDILNGNLKKYDLLLFFENYEPLGLSDNIDRLKISYFFDKDDKNNLYDKLSVMTRTYKNSFGSLKKEDILDKSNKIKGLYDAVQYVKDLCADDELLLEQLALIPLDDSLVYKETFNIVLFTNVKKYKTTKVINLEKPIRYNDQVISRIIINIIDSDNDLRNLKTIESVVRKMNDNISFDIHRFNDDEDLFSYYIK